MDTTATREKTFDEIRQECLRRSEKNLSPFNHVRFEDAQAVVRRLTSLDKDHWAEEWSKVGLPYEAKGDELAKRGGPDRKSTRLNSSHSQISYAVFCLKKTTSRPPEGTTKKSTPK